MGLEQKAGGFRSNNLDQVRQFQARRLSQVVPGLAGQSENAASAIQELFRSRHSLLLGKALVAQEQPLARQAEFFRGPSMLAVAEALSETPDDFRFQLGVLLSQVPYDQLSSRLKSNLSIQYESTPLAMIPFHPKYNWSLCAEGDQMLDASLTTGQALVINKNLLMKGISRPSVLCLNSFATENGTCLAGGWYAFENEAEVIEELRHIPRSGRKNGEVTSGTLVFLKDLRGDESKTRAERLADARAFAQNAASSKNPWYWRPNNFPTLPVE